MQNSIWENRLIQAAREGLVLDLSTDGKLQSVSTAVLRSFLTRDDIAVDPRGVNIFGARFDQPLNLDNFSIPFALRFANCVIPKISADGATIRDLHIIQSQIGTRACENSAIPCISARNIQIEANLNLAGTTLMNPRGEALVLDGSKISGTLFVEDAFTAMGQVLALDAQIGGQAIFRNASIYARKKVALALDGADIRRGLLVGEGLRVVGELRGVGASIGGPLMLSGATVENRDGVAVRLDGARVTGDLSAAEKFQAHGRFQAVGVRVSKHAVFDGASIKNGGGEALVLDGAQVDAGLHATDGFHTDGQVRAVGAKFGGQVVLSGARIGSSEGIALALDGAEITGGLFVNDGFHANGEVRTNGATIRGTADFQGAEIDGALRMERCNIEQLSLHCKSPRGIHLNFGEIALIATGLNPPVPLYAMGWKVSDLHGPLRYSWRATHYWLSSSPDPKPTQPWSAIADVFDRNGDPAGARRLRSAAANIATRQSPFVTKVARWGYRLLTGNGYYPLWSAVWLILVLLVGWTLVASSRDAIALTPNTQRTVSAQQKAPPVRSDYAPPVPITATEPCADTVYSPCFDSFAFTFSTVLPPVAIQTSDWTITSAALKAELGILKALAWLLTALLLAGVTGLLRKT